MTDSVRRKPWASLSEEEKAARRARLEAFGSKDPRERQELAELPRWVKTALIAKEILGMTWKKAAAEVNRSPKSLELYHRSPAAKKWIAQLREIADSPKALAEKFLQAHALDLSMERLLIYEQAKESGDWKLANAILEDLQNRVGPFKQTKLQPQEMRPVIHLTISSGQHPLEIPMGEVEVKRIGPPVVEAELVEDE